MSELLETRLARPSGWQWVPFNGGIQSVLAYEAGEPSIIDPQTYGGGKRGRKLATLVTAYHAVWFVALAAAGVVSYILSI